MPALEDNRTDENKVSNLEFQVPEPGGYNGTWIVCATKRGIDVDEAILIPWEWVREALAANQPSATESKDLP